MLPIFCSCFLLGVHFAGIYQVNYRKAGVFKQSRVFLGLGLLGQGENHADACPSLSSSSFWLKLGRVCLVVSLLFLCHKCEEESPASLPGRRAGELVGPKEIPGRKPKGWVVGQAKARVLFFILVSLFQSLVRETPVWGASG